MLAIIKKRLWWIVAAASLAIVFMAIAGSIVWETSAATGERRAVVIFAGVRLANLPEWADGLPAVAQRSSSRSDHWVVERTGFLSGVPSNPRGHYSSIRENLIYITELAQIVNLDARELEYIYGELENFQLNYPGGKVSVDYQLDPIKARAVYTVKSTGKTIVLLNK